MKRLYLLTRYKKKTKTLETFVSQLAQTRGPYLTTGTYKVIYAQNDKDISKLLKEMFLLEKGWKYDKEISQLHNNQTEYFGKPNDYRYRLYTIDFEDSDYELVMSVKASDGRGYTEKEKKHFADLDSLSTFLFENAQIEPLKYKFD
ncbi:MAG: hypothetical protein PHS44_00740 [Candidatus Dojkabacteria bacterium]|nr:hypothetical protein [Candidatus Dojkabacteria bacterium]